MKKVLVLVCVFFGISSVCCSVNAEDYWDIIDLGSFEGRYSIARAINASGEVSGYSQNVSGLMHSFFWNELSGMLHTILMITGVWLDRILVRMGIDMDIFGMQ